PGGRAARRRHPPGAGPGPGHRDLRLPARPDPGCAVRRAAARGAGPAARRLRPRAGRASRPRRGRHAGAAPPPAPPEADRRAAPARLAYHWVRAHDPARALPAAVEAGLQSQAAYGFADAQRHFELALELWDQVADADRRVG